MQTVIMVMVLLIVLLFSSLGYIWFSEVRYPLFGRFVHSAEDIRTLQSENAILKKINDSLTKELHPNIAYILATEIPDSNNGFFNDSLKYNGIPYAVLGTAYHQEEIIKIKNHLQPFLPFRCQTFKQTNGLLLPLE